MNKKWIAIVMLLAMVLTLFTGCKKAEPVEESSVEESSRVVKVAEESKEESSVEESSEESEESSEESSVEEKKEAKYTNPLTGLPCEKDYTGMRPYVFMCNNIEVAMPHCGVSQADMIFEMMDESGVTRCMVWFQDPTDVEKIGSVRSARQYNVETAFGYDAFLGHCGGSEEAMANIQNYGVLDIDQFWLGDAAYYRDPSRQYYGIEHSMFAIGEKCVKGAMEHFEYDPKHPDGFDNTYGMIFSENAVDQCTEKAESIDVAYYPWKHTQFEYDKDTNAYTMYQFGDEYNDDGKYGIPFANVINIYATTYLQADGVHLTIELDYGPGTYFTGGKAVAIKWYKDGLEDTFHFTLEDGTPLELTPGKTFLCVNQGGSHGQQGDCTWE